MDNLARTLGRILFAIPFGVFGLIHFFVADTMVAFVPSLIPGGVFWVYFIGLCELAACIAICTNYIARTASYCLAILLAVFILTIHLPGVLGDNMQMAMVSFLKDFALLGAALAIASTSRDRFPGKE